MREGDVWRRLETTNILRRNTPLDSVWNVLPAWPRRPCRDRRATPSSDGAKLSCSVRAPGLRAWQTAYLHIGRAGSDDSK